MTQSLEGRLRRLEEEREEADRRYNDALTQLDRAVPRTPVLPDPPLSFDDHQLATLNQAWNILEKPAPSGLRQKIASVVWRILAPYLHRQLMFNSALVDHINRNAEAARDAHRRNVEAAAALRAQIEAVGGFHANLIAYLQQITAYVDTKDRQSAGGSLVLNAAISNVAEGQAKYRESLEAREHRYQAAQNELRDVVVVTHQAVMTLKRAFEQLQPANADTSAADGARATPRVELPLEAAASLESFKYVGFEERFRGSQDDIRARQQSFVPFFAAARTRVTGVPANGDVLDVGCGRGEFIDLLQSHGIPARGIDLNAEMVEICRARGLRVEPVDAVSYLAGQPEGSLGGIFAAQVVEHMEPAYLLRFLDLCFERLEPGGMLVLETLNPACWTAFFESYIRDITHRWPLHPETLKYLVTASGFTRAVIEFRSPVPAHERLQPLALPSEADRVLTGIAEAFNENVAKLNARMFTHMDYAVVAEKAATGASAG